MGASVGNPISTLNRLYADNRHPVAFVDESYELRGPHSFYVIAVAVVHHEEVLATRTELSAFYNGRPLHAAPMFANREVVTLRLAAGLVARQNDGLDVVVCAPIGDDQTRDAARRRCLEVALLKVQADFSSRLFVIDSLSTPTENRLDQFTLSDLRQRPSDGLHRDSVAVHCRPSEELLLGLPDVLAWSYRQLRTGRDDSWFEPMRAFCDVTVV